MALSQFVAYVNSADEVLFLVARVTLQDFVKTVILPL